MGTQIIIVLCEGPHDVAFICKLLKSNGFVSNENKKLNAFPAPMGALMSQEVTKTNVEELNIQQIRQNILPLNTLQKNENYVFLYSMGGDGKISSRQDILINIKGFIREDGEIKRERLPPNTELSLIYFFDADIKGVNTRLAEVKAEVKTIIPSFPDTAFLNNCTYHIYEGIKFGVYIFTDENNNSGKLEDILIPLMRIDNDEIFAKAHNYIQEHYVEARTFRHKFSIGNAGVVETQNGERDFDIKKSIIGIAGQLQRSGKPNTVYISDTDYLSLVKINGNQKCQDIITFFNNFMNNL